MLKITWRVMLVVVGVLLATTLFAATASQDKPAMRSVIQPDLSLKTVLSPELLQTEKSIGTRTCRCSCGFPCKTDADCGPGGVCAAGISCCATGSSGDATAKIFQERENLSSRQTPSLIPAGVNCKQK